MEKDFSFEHMVTYSPKNWLRWGKDDEVGSVNLLTRDRLLRALHKVERGKVFTLSIPIGRHGGDPMSPGRQQTIHIITRDEGSYRSGAVSPLKAGIKYADDSLYIQLHGATHCDALGHEWIGDKIYNGFESESTIGGLSKASIMPLANHSIIGRGVLVDVARYKHREYLPSGYAITLNDLIGTIEKQHTEIESGDILLLRTGFLTTYLKDDNASVPKTLDEPGLDYSKELVDWFHEMDIAAYGTDTISGEKSNSSDPHVKDPLHVFLLSFLGIPILELMWLEELAEDCVEDHKYDFLFICSPLKIIGGTASPVNPLAIK
ncbi:MAG: cyclase family protein [Candidatus Thermoplasmatota archaeon]|nr:cyclase family protein [Candidatus Thermoplasmatota archaeon]MCL5252963.1 cyclase family protein [Candidatus Thermoplasmatota archaeon]